MLQSILPKPGSVWHGQARTTAPHEIGDKKTARVGPLDEFLSTGGQAAQAVKAADNMAEERMPSQTPTLESILDGDECGVVNVCIHKHKSRYSVFVDGYEAVPDEDGVVMLPAFRAYHRTSTRANRRSTNGVNEAVASPSPDTGIVTPVSISVIVEDGERDPTAVEVSTVQRTYIQDTVIHTDEFVNRTTLNPSNVSNGAYGQSVLVPYPSRYTRAPYIGIKDVTREKLRQFTRRSGTISFVIGSIFYGLVMLVSTYSGDNFENVGPVMSFFQDSLGLDSSNAFPAIGVISFGTLLDIYLATGLFTYVTSTLLFANAVASGTAFLGPAVVSSAIGRMAYSLLSTSATATKPSVRYIYFTLSELVAFLRTLQNEGAEAGQERSDPLFSYEERVLLSWMTESDTNVVSNAMGSLSNWVGQTLFYRSPFPSYGQLIDTGMNIRTLGRYTVETSVRVSIVDEQLCDGGMFVVRLSTRREEGLKAAAYHSGWLEDFDEFQREVAKATNFFTGVNGSIRARKALLGWANALLNKVIAVREQETIEAKKVRNGLAKIEREVSALWQSMGTWIKTREMFKSMPNKQIQVCRVLPFWLKMEPLGTTVRNHTSDVVSHQVEGEDGEAGDGILQPGIKHLQLAFSSASKTIQNTNEALNFYQNVWASERRIRPRVVQFWEGVDAGYPHGVSYLAATKDAYSDNNFEAVCIPDDITIRSIGWNRSSSAHDKLMIELVNGSFPDSDLTAANTAAAAAYAKLVVACVSSRHTAKEQIAASISVQRAINVKRSNALELVDVIVNKIGVHNLCTEDEMFIALPGGGCAFTLLFRLNLLRVDLRRPDYVTFGFSCREFVSQATVSSQNLLAKYISRGSEQELRRVGAQGKQAFAELSRKKFNDQSLSLPSQALYGLHSTSEAVPRLLSEAQGALTTLQQMCIGASIANDDCRRVVLASIESRPVLKLIDLSSSFSAATGGISLRTSLDGIRPLVESPLTYKQLAVRMASRDLSLPTTLPKLPVPIDTNSTEGADLEYDLATAFAKVKVSEKTIVYYVPFMEGDGVRTTSPAIHKAPLMEHTVPISLRILVDAIQGLSKQAASTATASIKDSFITDSKGLFRTPVDADPYRITLSYEQEGMRTVYVMMSHCGMQSVATERARDQSAVEEGVGDEGGGEEGGGEEGVGAEGGGVVGGGDEGADDGRGALGQSAGGGGFEWSTATLNYVIGSSRSETAVSTDLSYFKHDRIQETTMWNAERIVQASLAHASRPEQQYGAPFTVNVFKPMPWKQSLSDEKALNEQVKAIDSKIRAHEQTRLSTVESYYGKLNALMYDMQIGTLYDRATPEGLNELPEGTTIEDLVRRSSADRRRPGEEELSDREQRLLQVDQFEPVSPEGLAPPELTDDFMDAFFRSGSEERQRLRTQAIQLLESQQYAFDDAMEWAKSPEGRAAFEGAIDKLDETLIDTYRFKQTEIQFELRIALARLYDFRERSQVLETSWNGLADQAFFASVVLARCILQQTVGPMIEFQLVGFDGVKIDSTEMTILSRMEKGAQSALKKDLKWISVGEYCNLCAALCMSIDRGA